jgi:hypothetical protein
MQQPQIDPNVKDPAIEQWLIKLNQDTRKLRPWERIAGMENLTRLDQQKVVKNAKRSMRRSLLLIVALPLTFTWYLILKTFLPATQLSFVLEVMVVVVGGWVVMWPMEILIQRHFLKVELDKELR